MILKQTPKADSVFFSNNPIELHVQSEIGANHFFQVQILVNDILFDTQFWDKINDNDCYINLGGKFDNIFTNPFTPPTAIEIVRNNNLYKKITVIITEYNIDSLLVVATETLPSFYLLHNKTVNSFNGAAEIVLFSELHTLNKIDATTLLSIPVWVNKETVNFKIQSNNGVELFNTTKTTTKGVYEFKIPINQITLGGFSSLIVTINNTITLTYLITDFFRYQKTQLAVKNEYGFYEFAAFFGKLNVSPKYKRTVKEDYKEVKHIVEEDHTKIYKLESGYLSNTQRTALTALNKATDAYFLETDTFKRVLITTSKMLLSETNMFAANNAILFEYNHINAIDETAKYNVL